MKECQGFPRKRKLFSTAPEKRRPVPPVGRPVSGKRDGQTSRYWAAGSMGGSVPGMAWPSRTMLKMTWSGVEMVRHDPSQILFNTPLCIDEI